MSLPFPYACHRNFFLVSCAVSKRCSAARIDHKLAEDKQALNLCCPQSPQRELSDVEHRALTMKLIRLEMAFLSRERTPRHNRVRYGASEDGHRFATLHRSPSPGVAKAPTRLAYRPVPPHMMQHPKGVQHPPAIGVQHPPISDVQHHPAIGVQHPPITDVQNHPVKGVQRPPAKGVQHPPAMSVQHPPTAGFRHPPATGVQHPPTTGAQHHPAMSVHPPAPDLQHPPAMSVQYPPSTGIQHLSAISVQHPPTTGVQQLPATSVQHPPGTGIQHPPAISGGQHPPGAGVQHPPVVGGRPGIGVQPDMGTQPGSKQQVDMGGQRSMGMQPAPVTTVVETLLGASGPPRTSAPQGKSVPSPTVTTATSKVAAPPVAEGAAVQTPGAAITADVRGGAVAGAAAATSGARTATAGVNSASASAASAGVNITSGPSVASLSSGQGAFGPPKNGQDTVADPTNSFIDPSGRRHPYAVGVGLQHVPGKPPFASPTLPPPAAVAGAGAVLEGAPLGSKLLGVSRKGSPVEAPPKQKRRTLNERALNDRLDSVGMGSGGGNTGENGGGDPWAASTPDTPEDVAAMEYLKWELHGEGFAGVELEALVTFCTSFLSLRTV